MHRSGKYRITMRSLSREYTDIPHSNKIPKQRIHGRKGRTRLWLNKSESGVRGRAGEAGRGHTTQDLAGPSQQLGPLGEDPAQ